MTKACPRAVPFLTSARVWALLVPGLALAPSAAAAQELILEDALLGTTKGSYVGQAAGLTSAGFKPGAAHVRTTTGLLYRVGHILYELPFTIIEGRIEVEVQNFDPSTLGEAGDFAFVVQYDGRGFTEPISYDQFKSNFFRWNVHWRQNRKAMKCVLSLAKPGPERDDATVAIFPGAGDDLTKRDFTTEPTGEGVTWQSGKWHKLTIEWRNKTFEVKVDGVSKWRETGPWDYRPVVHRIWLGSGPGKYANSSETMVMRNFKVFSFRKETLRKDDPPPLNQVPRAPLQMPDAGAPTPAPAGGSGGGDAMGGSGGIPSAQPGESGGAPAEPGSGGAAGADESPPAVAGAGGRSGDDEAAAGGGSTNDDDEAKSSSSGSCLFASSAASPALPWCLVTLGLFCVARRRRR